eukprot:TRINITY_DN4849_c0_g1_i3.p1 TRINITY_DN4849_c0_g1~~TRINITY_DN4849_c0_g1_i3.p1  ORF type:complete len:583 (-),score=80.28 TRINITY_DN4849_c0_g1_i3:67-1815(-)
MTTSRGATVTSATAAYLNGQSTLASSFAHEKRFRRSDDRYCRSLPELQLKRAYHNSKKSDVMLALGSSLTVSPACDMPRNVGRKQDGHLVICNLQNTPLDELSDFVIHARTDQVMGKLMAQLGLPIPSWRLRRRVVFTSTFDEKTRTCEFHVAGLDADNDKIPASVFSRVEVLCINPDLRGVGEPTQLAEEPYIFKGVVASGVVAVKLHFMQYYKEHSLVLFHDLARPRAVHNLSYFPYDEEWCHEDTVSPNIDHLFFSVKGIEGYPEWSCYTNSAECYPPCCWPAMFAAQSKGVNCLFILGGATRIANNHIGVFNLDYHKWVSSSTGPNSPSCPYAAVTRWGHSVTVLPEAGANLGWIFGGWDGSSQYNSVHVFNAENGEVVEVETKMNPPHRGCHTAVAWRGKLVVFGGSICRGGPYQFYADSYLFDPTNKTWTELKCTGEIPSGRAQHAAVLLPDGHSMLVLGGFDGTKLLNELYICDLDTCQWRALPAPPKGILPEGKVPLKDFRVPAARCSAMLFGNQVVVHSALGAWILQEDWTWRKVPGAPGLLCHAVCKYGRKMLMFGGTYEQHDANLLHVLSL